MKRQLKRKALWAAVAAALIPALAVAWWLGSPLFVSNNVVEDFPLTAGALIPPDMSRTEAEGIMAKAAAETRLAGEAVSGAMAEAAKVATGAFRDGDSFHNGTGTATIYRLSDGARILRLENFSVTNGPDLRVILSPVQDPTTRAQATAPGYVELGKLKGNQGSQNYEIPDGVASVAAKSVVIYCKPFQVIFSVAPLSPVG